jgi:hypothetical protein
MNRHVLLLVCLLACTGNVPAAPPESLEIESAPGNVHFSHQRHADIECATCHHTSPGIRIKRACRNCHMAASRMPRNSPDAFHTHCLGCHLDRKKAGKPGGPAKRCSRCHTKGK